MNKENGKRLSIVIPQYNESTEELTPLLRLLDTQISIDYADIELIIVNDYSNAYLTEKDICWLKNIKPRLLRTKYNGGAGLCRQYGIDNSTGEWLMFIDADDMIYSILTLNSVLDAIKWAKSSDLIECKFLCEKINKNKITYNFMPVCYTWLHGKIYKRAFLDKHKIRFANSIRVNEDSYFNSIVYSYKPKVKALDVITYIWRHNQKSQTRIDGGKLAITGMRDFVNGRKKALKEIRPRNYQLYLETLCASVIYYYLVLQEDIWWKNIEREEKLRVYKTILEFKDYFAVDLEHIKRPEFIRIYNDNRKLFAGVVDFIEKETYNEFWKRIESECKRE